MWLIREIWSILGILIDFTNMVPFALDDYLSIQNSFVNNDYPINSNSFYLLKWLYLSNSFEMLEWLSFADSFLIHSNNI